MMRVLLICAGLFVACGIILFLEVFIPSGGLLTICALAALIAGIWISFQHDVTTGWIGLVGAIVIVPTVFGLAFKFLPKTRFGRHVTLTPPERPVGDGIPNSGLLAGLVGKKGTVLSPLRPVGICEIEGRRIECIAESGYLPAGAEVEVIGVQGAQLTVRAIRSSVC